MFQVLRNGELEELRLEETTDLRPGQIERFLVFPSAESFRFDIDGKRLEWGHKVISGRVLKKLAGVDPAKFAVWQVIPGKDDILVGDTDLICLADAGLEHFFTGAAPDHGRGCGMSLFPRQDRRYLEGRGITVREVIEGGKKGVILTGITLPEGKYQVAPGGYPDPAAALVSRGRPRHVLRRAASQAPCRPA